MARPAQLAHARWDLLDPEDPGKPAAPAELLSAEQIAGRLSRRTALLDEAHRQWLLHAPAAPALLTQLRVDLRGRDQRWGPAPHAAAIFGASAPAARFPGRGVFIALAALVVIPFTGYLWLFPRRGVVLLLLAGLLAMFALLLQALVRRADRDWMRRALVNRSCPDCGYDLRASPDALPPEPLGGFRVGPARCPECGVPWPLTPPGNP